MKIKPTEFDQYYYLRVRIGFHQEEMLEKALSRAHHLINDDMLRCTSGDKRYLPLVLGQVDITIDGVG